MVRVNAESGLFPSSLRMWWSMRSSVVCFVASFHFRSYHGNTTWRVNPCRVYSTAPRRSFTSCTILASSLSASVFVIALTVPSVFALRCRSSHQTASHF